MSESPGSCNFCLDFKNHYWEYEQEEGNIGEVPQLNFHDLLYSNLHLITTNYYTEAIYRGTKTFSFPTRQLLKCACGNYYLYRVYIPGGSNDAMRTYLCEMVLKFNQQQAINELNSFVKEYKANLTYNRESKEFLSKMAACENAVQEELALVTK